MLNITIKMLTDFVDEQNQNDVETPKNTSTTIPYNNIVLESFALFNSTATFIDLESNLAIHLH